MPHLVFTKVTSQYVGMYCLPYHPEFLANYEPVFTRLLGLSSEISLFDLLALLSLASLAVLSVSVEFDSALGVSSRSVLSDVEGPASLSSSSSSFSSSPSASFSSPEDSLSSSLCSFSLPES